MKSGKNARFGGDKANAPVVVRALNGMRDAAKRLWGNHRRTRARGSIAVDFT
jgi:hypothetical protein